MVRLWVDCVGRRSSGYGEAVGRLWGQLVRTVARESVERSADQHELCYIRPSADQHELCYVRPRADQHELCYIRPSTDQHELCYVRPSTDQHVLCYIRPSGDQHELSYACYIRHVRLIRWIGQNGVHNFRALPPLNTVSLQDQSASAVYGHNHS